MNLGKIISVLVNPPFHIFQLSVVSSPVFGIKSKLNRTESNNSLSKVNFDLKEPNTNSVYEKCQSELIRLQEEFKYGRLCIEEVETQLDVLKKQDLNKAQEYHKLDLEHLRAEWLKTQAQSVLRDDTLTETPKRNSLKKGKYAAYSYWYTGFVAFLLHFLNSYKHQFILYEIFFII